MTVPTDTEDLLAVHVGADGFEFVEASVALVDDSQTATIEVEHFSAMYV